MAEAPRITVQELKRRMDAGEDFTIVDVRNPNAWSESDTMVPEAIRIPLDKIQENLPRIPETRPIVAYCTWTQREFKRQFGAETSRIWLPERMGYSRWIPRMAGSRIARRDYTAGSMTVFTLVRNDKQSELLHVAVPRFGNGSRPNPNRQ